MDIGILYRRLLSFYIGLFERDVMMHRRDMCILGDIHVILGRMEDVLNRCLYANILMGINGLC